MLRKCYRKDKSCDKQLDEIYFDSLGEVKDLISNSNYKNYDIYHESKRESSFYGGVSFDESLINLQKGKENLTDVFISELNKHNKPAEAEDKNIVMDVVGTSYDIGSVIQGIPECCISDEKLPALKKYLKIYIDIGYCGGADMETINGRGIAIYQLIQNLMRDYIIDVYVIHYSYLFSQKEKSVLQVYKLSSFNNAPLLPQLAFIGTTEFYRQISGGMTGYQCEDPDGDGSYHNARSSLPSSLISELVKEGIFYIPGGYINENFNYHSQIKNFLPALKKMFNLFSNGEENYGKLGV